MVEISLAALFILFIVMLFILLSLFFYLLIKKYVNNQSRQKINELKEIYRLEMFQYLQTGELRLLDPNQSVEKFIALIELLHEYSNVLDDSDVKIRISSFAKKHLTKYVEKQLKQRRWSLRMNALYSIEDFYMDHLNLRLHELYKKKKTTIAEKTQILKLLAKFHDGKIVDYIKISHQNISDFSMLSILSNMDDNQIDQLVDCYDELSLRLQAILIDTIGNKQLIKHHQLLQKLVLNGEDEVKIRSLKAFATIGVPIDKKYVAPFFEAESWQIRMMATKVAGAQRMEEYKEKLIERLSDREFVVRSEAAKAILRFKDGVSILTKVTEDSEDMFAKDMAFEWLEKERGGYLY
jgi:HEAT repeat protein